jgi:hypothetical protein
LPWLSMPGGKASSSWLDTLSNISRKISSLLANWL